jgi:hypothetical protein
LAYPSNISLQRFRNLEVDLSTLPDFDLEPSNLVDAVDGHD